MSTTTETIAVAPQTLTPGDIVIPAGKVRPVEVHSVDNWGQHPNIWKVATNSRQGFNVVGVRDGDTINKVIN